MTITYRLIIDTDSYAGNFERAMCAYLTGRIGDCGVGKEFAENWRESFPDRLEMFDDLIYDIADEHGCSRPCSIWHSADGKEMNAVAIFFTERPSDEVVSFIKERAVGFSDFLITESTWIKSPVRILGFRLETDTTTTKSESL